jgi:DNA-directed RNA polymerase specialized sigma24 family protein
MAPRLRSNYRPAEVKDWIEEYEERRENRDTKPGGPLYTLLVLADIDQALKHLNRKEYEAVLLCGMCGIATRTAGVLVGVSAMAMSRRYRSGLETLTTYLNGARR